MSVGTGTGMGMGGEIGRRGSGRQRESEGGVAYVFSMRRRWVGVGIGRRGGGVGRAWRLGCLCEEFAVDLGIWY